MTLAVRLSGGLGNQLFQLCFAHSLHLSSSSTIMLDISAYNPDSTTRLSSLVSQPNEAYRIGRFKEKSSLISLPKFRDNPKSKAITFKSFETGRSEKLPIISEDYRQYVPYFTGLTSGYFVGTFASHKYWTSGINATLAWIREQISQVIGLTSETPTFDLAVHARRGDYLSNPKTRLFHGYCDTPYFKRAFENIKSRDSSIETVVISSDDLVFSHSLAVVARKFFKNVDVLEEQSAIKTMIQLSNCRTFIGSNSTFSWWAGYLNPKEINVFPQKWFVSNKIAFSPELFFPDSPILIDYELLR